MKERNYRLVSDCSGRRRDVTMIRDEGENYFERIIELSSTTNTYRLLMELRELKNLGYDYVVCPWGYRFNIFKLIRHIKYLEEKGYTFDQIKENVMNCK